MMTAADKPRKPRTPRRQASRLPGEILLEQEVENLLELMQRVFLLAGDKSNLDTLLEVLEGYGISCTRLVTMLRAGQALSSSDENRRC